MPRSKPTYDTSSYDLAELFMLDAPPFKADRKKKLTEDLAIEIQKVIEDWFEYQGRCGWVDDGQSMKPEK